MITITITTISSMDDFLKFSPVFSTETPPLPFSMVLMFHIVYTCPAMKPPLNICTVPMASDVE